MNLMDVVCILIILLFTVWGFKRGVIKSIVQLVGTCTVLVLAFVFKDFIANLLMDFLPFYNFGGVFNGISSINILIYELIAFILLLAVTGLASGVSLEAGPPPKIHAPTLAPLGK